MPKVPKLSNIDSSWDFGYLLEYQRRNWVLGFFRIGLQVLGTIVTEDWGIGLGLIISQDLSYLHQILISDNVRPAFSITTSGPGSDLAGETAAALASSAIWFRMRGEADYADQCLSHARTLFKFADEYRGKYTDTIPAGGFYESWSGYNDEIVWAAAWIAKVSVISIDWWH